MTSVGADTETDGRVQRGIRTHTRIVESLLDLINDEAGDPTAHQIAEVAGVSVRTIFQHFSDMEALYEDLVKAQTQRFTPLFESLDSTGTFEQRLVALGEQRRELYGHIGPVRRAITGRSADSPAVKARLTTVSTALREQTLQHFEPELSRLTGGRREQASETLDLIWSFEAWDRLVTAQSLAPEPAATLLVTLTKGLLNP